MDWKSLLALLSFLLALLKFILDEFRRMKTNKEGKKQRQQLEDAEKENGAYPPRKDKHQRR